MSEVNVTQKMQEILSRLPGTDALPYTSFLTPEYTREHLAMSLTPANLILTMHRAREAQEIAVSYRDFKVGAAVVGLSFFPSKHQIMTGVNVKPDEESNMNVHAEQTALQKAHDRHADLVSMVVVVGETQADKQSGKDMHTLHPCGICRGVMMGDTLIDNDATLIASTLPDFSKIEFYSVNALQQFHDTHDATLIHKFELPPLSLFKPVVKQLEPFVLKDTDETLADERIWNDTIGTFLGERRMELLKDL